MEHFIALIQVISSATLREILSITCSTPEVHARQPRIPGHSRKSLFEIHMLKYLSEKVHLDDLDLYVITFIALATSVLL